jgi:predicted MFS family arabinose efflux permease
MDSNEGFSENISNPRAPLNGRYYVLAALLAASTVNFLDRQLPAILLPSIRRELALSDSQLGFITGPAFAFFFCIMGVPLGRLTDRVNRRSLLAVCMAFWSAMTVISGLATAFYQLAIARFGVGIGEAGVTPTAHSMISDIFPPQGRATALAIYQLGVPVGTLLVFGFGGWTDSLIGWRMTFAAMGLPGLLLALLIRFTIGEPTRGHADGLTDLGRPPAFSSVLKTLWQFPTYRLAILGTGFTGIAFTGTISWAPSFLSRSFGIAPAQSGEYLAPAIGLGGILGTFLGGYLADRLRDRGVQWVLRVPAVAVALVVIPSLFAFRTPSFIWTMILVAIPVTLCPAHLAPYSAVLQGLSSLRIRGTTPAVSLLLTVLISSAMGMQLIGWVSDLFKPIYNEASLAHSLTIVIPTSAAFGSLFFSLASRTFPADLARADIGR